MPGDLLECSTAVTTTTECGDETKPDKEQSVIQLKRKRNDPLKEGKKKRLRGPVLEGPVFQCDICNFQTGREATLKNHKERKHDNTYYLCEPCSGMELQLYVLDMYSLPLLIFKQRSCLYEVLNLSVRKSAVT